MPLSNYGSIPLANAGESSKSAYLVKFPEETWSRLQDAISTGQGVSMSFNDSMELYLPDSKIPLNVQSLGAQTEIYTFPSSSSSPSLSPLAIANHRLTLPIPSATTSRAADRLRTQSQVLDKQRKDNADRVNGVTPNPEDGRPKAEVPSGPIIPLKTRVIQLLALGEISLDDIVKKVGMAEQEVMRVVNVVGRQTSSQNYTLQPSKYTQVKIQPWKYTHAEKLRVIKLAHLAFDELDLPPDADERLELEKKEAEVSRSASGSSSSSDNDKAPYTPLNAQVASTPPRSQGKSEGGSVGGSPGVVKKERGRKPKATGIIGKQMAKFANEKRAGSLPNLKVEGNGTASPMVAEKVITPVPAEVEKVEEKPKKTKLELAIEARKAKKEKSRRDSEQSNAQSEGVSLGEEIPVEKKVNKRKAELEKEDPSKRSKSEDRGRARESKPVVPPLKRSRDYSSSPSTSPEPVPKPRSPIKRKSPPPALNLLPKQKIEASVDVPPPNLTPKSVHHPIHEEKEKIPDPEAMRERYEELIPAYELLTGKLRKLHEEAQEGEVGLGEAEVGKMVERWGRWHKELEGIRRWFGEG